MKCEQFRKKLLEAPGNEDVDFHAHRKICPRCEQSFQQAMVFEKHLAEAFSDSAGENSEEKNPDAILANLVGRRRTRRRVFSIAASLVLLVITGFTTIYLNQFRSLDEFVFAHIDHEIEQLNNTGIVSQARLKSFISQFDMPDLSALPAVTYVEKCWMRSSFGLHLILKGDRGPVTLLFMPNESLQHNRLIESQDFSGKLYRFGQGSFALVGRHGESLEMLAEKLRMSWGAAAIPLP